MESSTKTVTVWITKYWETEGIIKAEGQFGSHKGYFTQWNDYGFRDFYMPGAFDTEEAAKAHVKSLAKNKVASLQKKIDSITEKWLK